MKLNLIYIGNCITNEKIWTFVEVFGFSKT